MRKIPSPHDNTPSIDRQLGLWVNIRPYATGWHGENGDALLLLLTYFTTPLSVCQYLFEIFSFFLFFPIFRGVQLTFFYSIICLQFPFGRVPMTFQRHFSHFRAKSTKNFGFFDDFFYCVSFFTKIWAKNRLKWIFTNGGF